MTTTTRRTSFSITILVGLGVEFLTVEVFRSATVWGSLAATLVLGMATGLWIKGLNNAGKGWRRALFLTAFAAPIVWIGMGISDFAHGAYEGWNGAYPLDGSLAAQEPSETGKPLKPGAPLPPNPVPVMPPGLQLVSWIFLTAALAKMLDLLERRSAEADRQRDLARIARDESLRSKLAPHFIFNALNTLHAQIGADPKGAEATTEKLASLFREVLEVSDKVTIPLKQELSFVEAYLGIEQARLGDRLTVRIEVSEEMENLQVPPMSLQVLVENAIKHGVAPCERGGEIVIGVWGIPEYCEVYVEDPGNGLSNSKGTGTALETLRQRLARPEDLQMGMVNGRHRVSFRWRQA